MTPPGRDAWRRTAPVALAACLLLATSCGATAEPPVSAADDGAQTGTPRTTGSAGDEGPAQQPERVEYEVVVAAEHPHDPEAYTQGLEFIDGRLLESTGRVGESSIRLVDPVTGLVEDSVAIPEPLFAEGATVVGDEIWQLTWKNEVVLVRSLDGLEEQRRLAYDGEGWGLCAADDRLIMSDGSSRLTFRDPAGFAVIGSVDVVDRGEPIDRLNELECVGDRVWANIYQTDRIVSINPETGVVDGIVSIGGLIPAEVADSDSTNVANGIAFDERTGRFWLTGKRWPVMYEVELQPIG